MMIQMVINGKNINQIYNCDWKSDCVWLYSIIN